MPITVNWSDLEIAFERNSPDQESFLDLENGDLLSIADRDQLERGFRRLDPQQRALLVLRHFAGYEPSEIAEILGIPAGTARSRLHHAHRAMRAALEADARATAIGGQLA